MPSYTRMKKIFLDGLLWLYLFEFGFMALSLEPGFLDFDNLPDTNFTCVGKVIGGYYADLETNCQMFHVCTIGQLDEPMDIRFLCLNGTVFDQETRVCERIDEVDCTKSEQFYSLNLELYGNTGPILEESPDAQETEQPLIIKSTSSTTTTTTTSTTKRPTTKPTRPPYYTTPRPPTATTPSPGKHQVLSQHHFPVNSPDIRFNPEEINISLNPGAPPDIRTKLQNFPTLGFSDSSKVLVTSNTNNAEEQSDKVQLPRQGSDRPHVSSSTSPKSVYTMDISESDSGSKLPQNSDDSFGFAEQEYHTKLPQQQFLIQTNSFRHSQSFPPNVNHNAYQNHQYHSSTIKHPNNYQQDQSHTTLRTIYLQSLKPPQIHQHHHYTLHRTDKPPQRVQIPIPLLPTLPPLTFSSPAPFSLQRHVEHKRYTKDHQAPPRIIISASASVSDASGRRLNYSLGTIGAGQILETPPSSYDEYKDSDVGLDPFFHDVPKLKQRRRRRRNTKEEKINPFEIIRNEKEAVDVLKFLFTWYKSHQATATVAPVTIPVSPDLIQQINRELAPTGVDVSLLTDSSEVHYTRSKDSTTESLHPELTEQERLTKHIEFNKGETISEIDKMIEHFTEIQGKVGLNPENVDVSNTNVGKVIEKTDMVSDIYNISEIKEKSDNIKETPFNPDDYVDDNYEAAVYTEQKNPPKKEETNNLKNSVTKFLIESQPPEIGKNAEKVIDQTSIDKLYKYFNINYINDSTTTQRDIVLEEVQAEKEYELAVQRNEDIYHKELNETHESNEDIIYNNTAKIDTVTEDKINNTDKYFENKEESLKYTEINVFSEVHENGDTLKQSSIKSSTSTTTTTATTTTTERSQSRNTIKRRGRGRQRHVNYNRGSNSILDTTEHNSLQQNKSKITTDENKVVSGYFSEGRTQSRRSRKRGRSRFVDYLSTSTPPSKEDTNLETTENLVEKGTTPFFNDIKNNFTEHYTTELYNKAEDTTLDLVPHVNTEEYFQHIKNQEELPSSTEPFLKTTFSKEDETTFEDFTDHSKTELKHNEGDFKPNLNESMNSTEEIAKDGLVPQENLFNGSYVKKEHDISLIHPIEYNTSDTTERYSLVMIPETTETIIISTTLETSVMEHKNKASSATPDSSSYLIKLLKYFSETTPEYTQSTSEAPVNSYHPGTVAKNKLITTEETIVPVTPGSRARSRQKGIKMYSLRVTTELPTLRDIYENSSTSEENSNPTQPDDQYQTTNLKYESISQLPEPVKDSDPLLKENKHIKSKSELLERLSIIEENLAEQTSINPVSNSPIVDTTVTTPFSSFENYESFGTTFSPTTQPSKLPIDSTEITTEHKNVFEYSTESKLFVGPDKTETNKDEYSLLDEAFVVPELTEQSRERSENLNDHEKNILSKGEKNSITENINAISSRSTEYTEVSSSLISLLEESTTKSSISELSPLKIHIKEQNETSVSITVLESTPEVLHIADDNFRSTTSLIDEPEVEIQKSISLPVNILKSSFNYSYDINNAQEVINNLSSTPDHSTLLSPTSTFPTVTASPLSTENLIEFIQEVEVITKSIVAKDDHAKYALTENVNGVVTDTIPTTILTTESTREEANITFLPEIRYNSTEIIFVKNTEPAKSFTSDTTTSTPTASILRETPGMVNSSHLLQVLVEITTIDPVTTISTTTIKPYHTRKTRPPKRRPYQARNKFGRHRFSTELVTPRTKLKNEESEYITNLLVSHLDKENITDAPLHRSATPTRSELRKVSLHTTPVSSTRSRYPTKVTKHYVFNCFSKKMNTFYADPRDCRLFHYCTQGYSKNQLLDLKYVCDLKTFFDDEKLICTNVKPERCL